MTREQPQSNFRQGLIVLLFVVDVFLLVAINTSADHFNLFKVVDSLDKQAIITSASVVPSHPEMRLEWKLEERYIQGEFEVEKYREYEIYVDEDNQIIKEIPTAHYNFLKYWRY